MGYTSSGGTKGLGVFNNTPSTVSDLNQLRDLIARVGNYRVGTTTERNAVTGTQLYEGLLWYDTTLDAEYVYNGSGWIRTHAAVTTTPITYTGIYSESSYANVLAVKDQGRVFLEGVIVSTSATFNMGTTYTIAAVGGLPIGYRPAVLRTFACSANATAIAAVNITDDGSITFTTNVGFTGALALDVSGANWRAV